jgi:serine/threonine-protein phosphatase 2A regulatory subunit A
MVDQLVSDEIPNIRFNVAKSYGVLVDVLKRLPEQGTIAALEKEGKPFKGCPKGLELIHEKILPNLEKLQQDDDVDVRYFATTAAQGFGDEMQT